MNTFKCFVFVFALAINSLTNAYDYECNVPLLDKAHLTATTSLPERGAKNARLNGGNAWTASSSDFGQYLTIDLGQVMNITAVATQGRAHKNEYVMEYGISYGTNGLDYVDFKEESGNIKMFKGNTNGDTIKLNKFEVPIIAQWIRINPTRWRDRISLRLELYGCDYESDVLSFNGSSLVRLDLLREPIETDRHSIRFRFKTNFADGILMYSRGTQGDFIALQLRDNRMLLNIDLGSGVMTSLSVGSLLDDNMWHDVVISRNRKNISFSVDRVLIKERIKGEFHRLDLNRALYIGGVPNKQEGLVIGQNFTGCIENFYLNTTNIIHDLKETEYTGENLRYQKVHALYNCPEPPVIPISFLTPGSYARLKGYEGIQSLNVSLGFRSYEDRGIILYHKFTSPGHVKLFLEQGKLKVEIETGKSAKVILDNFEGKFNDGKWHQVILTVAQNTLILNVDDRPMRTKRLLEMITGPIYWVGGMSGEESNRGFVGCMRMISIDGNYKIPTDWKEEEYCCKNEVVFDACQMVDRCNPNPCKHSGICSQNSDEFFCDCTHTGYSGAVCHTSLYPLSCEAYKNMNSVNQRAEIKIDVDGSGPLAPFPVTCEFFTDGRVMTVLRHSNEYPTPVDGFEEPGSFIQDINYDADLDQIEAFLNRSTRCRQRIKYECKHSKLFNTPVGQNDYFKPNSWWVSRQNQKMDYWGGALPGSRKCECGILGNCADPNKWCNCDADLEGRLEDSGDITEKEYLPVKQLRFGDTGTALDEKEGKYTLGSLICEGDEIGVNMRSNSMIKYDFMGSWRSTISEKIRVGFTTTNPKGFLLGLFSNISGEYMTIMVSNSGHLRVVFDFGFERQEVIFPSKHFGLGQYHDVRLSRKNSGSVLVLKVDNYEPKEFHFDIKTSADAQFNNIQYMYIGKNESMTEGFAGCISRVEFDDIYPLKLLFQENGPGNIRSLSNTPITEDYCGVEPITHPPNIVETRPPPDVDENKVRAAYNETDTAILGSVLAVIIIALVIMAVLIGRYMSRHKGEYLTQEDKGAEIALDPDSAVVHSTTGHQVQKKKEWFI
ncbi:PREDICTED: neurexin-4 isoform X6 [Polistes dominula]|uniref:Neurexin-4 isoform X6 n=1 Tax=Polistes dominula TaxID=743375 RepID=A0ABM1INH7_POLDO|nr:PREDICTED: neurexin-4 isoform X6 [Polistes dominula]